MHDTRCCSPHFIILPTYFSGNSRYYDTYLEQKLGWYYAAMQQINTLPTLANLPQGVIRDQVGEDELQQELLDNFAVALLAGILLVFAVLVLLYKRLMSPLVNMTSLALAPLGGIFLVWIVGQPLSMPVLIGILLLLGIVSKN